ncbi:LAETG motif-containing sortase-dependent surface protein [Streptomyces sp. S1D4-11]
MKLRRAMALAAATAAIAPLALLSAPAAFAEETPSPTATVSETASEPASTTPTETTPAPSETPSASATETTPTPSATATTSTSATPAPSTTSPEPSDTPEPEPSECQDSKVDVSISGLPGKIAAGSGWHKFSLNVLNNSKSTLNELGFFGLSASSDKAGDDLFQSKKVQLQAYNEDTKAWEDVDSEGYAVGYVGYTDELKPDYEVDIPLRINVKSSAPVGAGFSLGASIYGDTDGQCTGFGEVAYKFQIVSSGTDTDGTKPQEGGKVPVSDKPADKGNTPEVNGSLAETGSSSALPMIALAGGIAVVAGAGAVFVVRRRKSGDATA